LPYLSNAGNFLISTLFGIYILFVLLRLLLQLTRADFYNPVSQFIVKITTRPLRFLRRFIPGFAGIDCAAVVLLLALQIIELWLLFWISGVSPAPAGLMVLSIAELLKLAVYVFMFSIFIQVILSWVAPGTYNPILSLLYSLNEPLLRPARRLLPSAGGLDFSPILALIVLQLLMMLFVHPLRDFGQTLL
jgi:YggT family protein